MDFNLKGDNAIVDALRVAVALLDAAPEKYEKLMYVHRAMGCCAGVHLGDLEPLSTREEARLEEMEEENRQVWARAYTYDSLKRTLVSIVSGFESYMDHRGRDAHGLTLNIRPQPPKFEDPSKDPES